MHIGVWGVAIWTMTMRPTYSSLHTPLSSLSVPFPYLWEALFYNETNCVCISSCQSYQPSAFDSVISSQTLVYYVPNSDCASSPKMSYRAPATWYYPKIAVHVISTKSLLVSSAKHTSSSHTYSMPVVIHHRPICYICLSE